MSSGFEEITDLLLEAGADVTAVNTGGRTALHYAVRSELMPHVPRTDGLQYAAALHDVPVRVLLKITKGLDAAITAKAGETYQAFMPLFLQGRRARAGQTY